MMKRFPDFENIQPQFVYVADLKILKIRITEIFPQPLSSQLISNSKMKTPKLTAPMFWNNRISLFLCKMFELETLQCKK